MITDLNLNPDQILLQFKKLKCNEYPLGAINILHQHPEIFEQKLLSLIDECISQITDEVDDRHIVALFTLAKYRSKKAYPKIIKLLQSTEDVDVFFGDLITESVPIILAACFDGDLNKCKEMLLTKNIDICARLAPICSLKYLVATKQISLSQAIELIEQVAESIIDEGFEENLKSGNILELIMDELSRFSVLKYDEFTIRKNWQPQEGWIFDLKREVEYLRKNHASEDNSYYLSEETDCIDRFNELMNEGILSVSSWLGIKEKVDYDNDDMYFKNQPIAKVKIGRNELCPCDSGKKYKKCCIA